MPYRSRNALFVLTGAPGSGKTAILNRLRGEFRCVDEPARVILAEQRATGGTGTWDEDASLFVRLLLQCSIEDHRMAERSGDTVIFDRGIPDCAVYAARAGLNRTQNVTAIETFRYHDHVLFLPPWGEIYRTDAERIMSFEDTVSFSDALRDVYGRFGYVLVDVPRGSVANRAAFVRELVLEHTVPGST